MTPCSFSPQRTLGEVAILASMPGWWNIPAVKVSLPVKRKISLPLSLFLSPLSLSSSLSLFLSLPPSLSLPLSLSLSLSLSFSLPPLDLHPPFPYHSHPHVPPVPKNTADVCHSLPPFTLAFHSHVCLSPIPPTFSWIRPPHSWFRPPPSPFLSPFFPLPFPLLPPSFPLPCLPIIEARGVYNRSCVVQPARSPFIGRCGTFGAHPPPLAGGGAC